MEKELISIVVPIYNVEKYLRKCIDSIINQTYKNLEIILVDDESPDNCGEICEEYAKKDNRIVVIHKKNGGLSDARNAGIEVATGKYIGFVDSDDYIKEDMYENLYNDIKKYDVDISICKYIEVFENSTIYEDASNSNKIEIYDNVEMLKRLLYNNNVTDHACNKLYKIDLFKINNIRYPNGYMYEDIGTTYLLFENSKKISLSEKNEYYYVRRGSSILGQVNEKLIFDLLKMLNNRFEYLEHKFPELKNELIKNKMRFIIIVFRYICILKKVNLLENEYIKREYNFYRKNFNLSKKYIVEIQNSIVEKFECYLLYFNKKCYWNYYKVKLLLKKFLKGKKNVK